MAPYVLNGSLYVRQYNIRRYISGASIYTLCPNMYDLSEIDQEECCKHMYYSPSYLKCTLIVKLYVSDFS